MTLAAAAATAAAQAAAAAQAGAAAASQAATSGWAEGPAAAAAAMVPGAPAAPPVPVPGAGAAPGGAAEQEGGRETPGNPSERRPHPGTESTCLQEALWSVSKFLPLLSSDILPGLPGL